MNNYNSYDNNSPQASAPPADNFIPPAQPQGYAGHQRIQDNQPVMNPAQPQSSFIADQRTTELLRTVHPELASAMINIAIKKFARSEDFVAYFVKEEFKAQAEQQTQPDPNASIQGPDNSVATSLDFGSGW